MQQLPRCIPPVETWKHLVPALTQGELRLALKLNKELPNGWTIAVGRKILGIRPDILCVHPQYGVVIFEVKDWTPGSRRLKVEGGQIIATNSGEVSSYVTDNPVEQVLWYREVMSELFSNVSDSEVLITSVVAMTYLDDEEVENLFAPLIPRIWKDKKLQPFMVVAGKDSLSRPPQNLLVNVHRQFPPRLEAHRRGIELSPRTWDHLCWWLKVPELEIERYQPLELDQQKMEFLENRSQSKRRKVRGPVGSGKSTLLAARAAQAVANDQRVLILSFTITLRHWLHLLIVRAGLRESNLPQGEISSSVKELVDRRYMHEFAKQIAIETGYGSRFNELISNRGEYPESGVLDLMEQIAAENPGILSYDVILVDEMQNVDVRWLEVLQKLSRPIAEIVIFGDPTQNVYEKDMSWVNKPLRGFPGRWTELKGSFRFPPGLYPVLSDFFRRFELSIEGTPEPLAAQAGLFDEVNLRWMSCSESELVKLSQEVVRSAATLGYSPMDTVFLSFSHRVGLEFLQGIAPEKFKEREPTHELDGFAHVFHSDKRHQSHLKKAFWPMSGEIKLCTVKSFQGWEARFVVLAISPEQDQRSESQTLPDAFVREVYVGLSRLARSLSISEIFVVNAERRLDDFFSEHFTRVNQSSQSVDVEPVVPNLDPDN